MNKKIIKNQILVFREVFKTKKILREASALTVTTILEIVPFLVFVLYIISQTPVFNYCSKFKDSLLTILLPHSIDSISIYFKSFFAKRYSYNILNFLFITIISYSLFNVITNTFDNILNVHKKHRLKFFNRIIKFFGMILIGSLFITVIISSVLSILIGYVSQYPIVNILLRFFIPFTILFISLIFTYSSVPTINLRVSSIVYTSLITAAIWIFVKLSFDFYIEYLTNIEVIYSFLAFIPIFVIWIYINWIIILSGVIVVSILEKRYQFDQKISPAKNSLRIIIEKDFKKDIDIKFKNKNDKLIENILRLIKDEQ
jgi:membrane protein